MTTDIETAPVEGLGVARFLIAPPLTILPYAPGVYLPDLLYEVWRMLFEWQLIRRTFYFLPPATAETLEVVLGYLTQTRLFLVYESQAIAGIVWFSDCRPQHGNIGLAYRPSCRGVFAEDATDRVCRAAFQLYGWQRIWGFSPYRAALAHGVAIGFQHVMTLPRYTQIGQRTYPLHVAKRERPAEETASCLAP